MDKNANDLLSSSSVCYIESNLNQTCEYKRRRKLLFFRKNALLNISTSSCDADLSAIDHENDLTPGSLAVWSDLPKQIKFDPSLAPFKQLYEQEHGKFETIETERDGDIENKITELRPLGEIVDDGKDSEHRLMTPLDESKEKRTKSTNKIQLVRAVRIIKLSALIACWVLLTMSLILNQEKTDVVLHTAVKETEIKEYELQPTNNRLRILVTLTGPFSQNTGNRSEQNKLYLWMQRSVESNISKILHEQNSTYLTVYLQNDDILDFSPSVTETRTITLENSKHSVFSNNYSNDAGRLENGAIGYAVYNNEKPTLDDKSTKVTLKMRTTGNRTVPLTLSYQLNPLDEEQSIIYATMLLCSLYTLIILEIVNRTIATLLSSSLGIAVLALNGARPSLPELVSWLDVETLLLLFSMMVLVAILAETGLFDYMAVIAFERTGGRTWPLINCLCFFTALFSTFLDNVTTVLLMTPVTIRLCEVMQLNPVPVLMAMVIFSNVGGAATPVGDPPNVIIASHPSVLRENINFTSFSLHMGLGIILVGIQTYFQLRYMFRNINTLRHSVPRDIQELRQELAVWRRAAASLSSYSRDEDIVRKALEKKVDKLNAALTKREAGGGVSKSDPMFCSTLAQMKQKYRIRDKPLLIKSTVCVTFVVVVFFLHAIPELQRLSLGWTALLGALLLLLLAEREDLEPILARVEWSTLLFFAALFVLMEALSKLGLIIWIGKITESLILKVGEESRLAVAIMLILWVSGLASAFVDNIPLTTMMVRVTAALADPNGLGLPLAPLVWALSFGACLGGNGTLIGASANVVCAGVAEQHGYRFTFLQYLKIGFPIMIGNLLIASVYLLMSHCVFKWH